MGKEKEIREHRIDYKKSISGKKVERLLITAKKVKVSVQPMQSNKIQMWLQGEAASEVILKTRKREKEQVIMLQEGSDIKNVVLKIAIPTTIKYLSIGTASADVKIKNVLPKELRIKTNNGLVDISTPDMDRECEININTQYADIQVQIIGHVELDSRSITGETHDHHKTNGKSIVKIKARSISGDITVL